MPLVPCTIVPKAVRNHAEAWYERRGEPSMPSLSEYFGRPFEHFVRVYNPQNDDGDRVEGSVDPEVIRALVPVLDAATSTPDDCYFLLWEGYAGLEPEFEAAATVNFGPYRTMHIASGPLTEAGWSPYGEYGSRTSQWWIPADGAWAFGNDIYGKSTYCAGSAGLIQRILDDPRLDTEAVTGESILVAEELD